MTPFVRLPVLARLLAVLCCGLGAARAAEPATLRVGFFPNLTHAPALAARQLEREQADWHRSRLPAGTRLEWRAFNAGPSAMEALLAGAVDVTYVGPSPALNAHVRTKGAEIRVLATVARAGNALVVRKGAGLATPADFRGRRLGTPQLGNTQDIDARVWLRSGGLRVHLGGGDAQVVPAQNAELMLLFSRGDIDAAWTVEPWVTRLTEEFGGEILVEKKEAPITLLVTSVSALGRRRAEIEAFVRTRRCATSCSRTDPITSASCAPASPPRPVRRRLRSPWSIPPWGGWCSIRGKIPRRARPGSRPRSPARCRMPATPGCSGATSPCGACWMSWSRTRFRPPSKRLPAPVFRPEMGEKQGIPILIIIS